MKGREGKGPPSTDLLVCFPSRAHLTLMPKHLCSPARPSESSKRQHNHAKHLHHHHLKRSSTRSGGAGQASPLLWAKTKPISKDISEPTSPKVTCAGQIKVRSKPVSSCKNWQSVMEEIERLHNNRKHKKKSAWVEAFGFKKDVMQFLTCLRNIRFDFRCFGSFSTSGITSDDDEDEEEDYQEPRISKAASDDSETSRTVFSKWFMVLQENNNGDLFKKEITNKEKDKSHNEVSTEEAPCAPPPNALLLMRCRSAPAKSWLQDRQEVEEEEEEEQSNNDDEDEKQKEDDEKNAKQAMEEENSRKENLVVMRYGTDFYKFSSDIAKETWVVGGIRDPLTRSRSWKR